MKILQFILVVSSIKQCFLTPAQYAVEKALDLYIPSILNITQREWLEIKVNFTSPLDGNFHCTRRSCTFPGTKWCGPGNTASSYDDLGPDRETDICCRDHDFCPVSVDPGKEQCGFKNTGHFTVSGCNCDFNLINCLLNRRTIRATVIGYLFSIFMSECLDLKHGGEICTLKNEGIGMLIFIKNLLMKMSRDERFKDILKEYLSHDPFKIYKCYQYAPYSGDIFLDECKISCAITDPFSTTTEYYSLFDCNIMRLICCDLKDSPWCNSLTPPLVATHCSNSIHFDYWILSCFIMVIILGLIIGLCIITVFLKQWFSAFTVVKIKYTGLR